MLSNFNYCPIMCNSCGKTCTKKIEAMQDLCLMIRQVHTVHY